MKALMNKQIQRKMFLTTYVNKKNTKLIPTGVEVND